jgi:hypothetical protein
VDLGSEGADLVVQVVRDHPSVGAISSLGVITAETLDPSDELIESLADILLNDASWRSAGYMDPLLARLVEASTKKMHVAVSKSSPGSSGLLTQLGALVVGCSIFRRGRLVTSRMTTQTIVFRDWFVHSPGLAAEQSSGCLSITSLR